MHLLITLLSLATLLQPSLEEERDLGRHSKGDSKNVLTPEEQTLILNKHNDGRRGVTPTASNMLKMTWDEEVAKNAEKAGKKCRSTGRISPAADRTMAEVLCGENLLLSNLVISWTEVLSDWFNTRSNFKYGVGKIDPKEKIGAYTQMVWYNSHKLGCATVECPDPDFPFRYICHYCPGGNIKGKVATPYKKGPSCGDCPNNCEDKLCTNPCPQANYAHNCEEMKKELTCENESLKQECKASCSCKTEII